MTKAKLVKKIFSFILLSTIAAFMFTSCKAKIVYLIKNYEKSEANCKPVYYLFNFDHSGKLIKYKENIDRK